MKYSIETRYPVEILTTPCHKLWIKETNVTNHPDFKDPRFNGACDTCPEGRGIFLRSFKQYSHTGRPERDAHRLHCAKCLNEITGDLPYSRQEVENKGEWVMPFGKHKGQMLKDIPVDYLKWAAVNLTGNVAQAIKAHLNYLDQRQTNQDGF